RDLRGPSEGQFQSLHPQDHAPAENAEEQGQSHEQKREAEPAEMDAAKRFPKARGSFVPAETPLARARGAGPFRGRMRAARFGDEDAMEDPKQKHGAESEAPPFLPDLFHARGGGVTRAPRWP